MHDDACLSLVRCCVGAHARTYAHMICRALRSTRFHSRFGVSDPVVANARVCTAPRTALAFRKVQSPLSTGRGSPLKQEDCATCTSTRSLGFRCRLIVETRLSCNKGGSGESFPSYLKCGRKMNVPASLRSKGCRLIRSGFAGARCR